MKCLFIAVLLVANTATVMVGDSDALKAIMRLKSYDEAKAMVNSSIGSLANDEEKAKAYNHLVDLAMEKVQAVMGVINSNAKAEQMGTGKLEAYDKNDFYQALYNAYADAAECDRYDNKPNEKDVIKTKYHKANAERLWNLRKHLINGGHYFQEKGDLPNAYKYLAMYVDSNKYTLFSEQNTSADDKLTIIAYYAAMFAFQNNDLRAVEKYADIAMDNPDKASDAIRLKNAAIEAIQKSNVAVATDPRSVIPDGENVVVDSVRTASAPSHKKSNSPVSSSSSTSSQNITITVNGVTFTMVYVQGGTFTMGATTEQGSDAYSDEKPAHRVTLSDYYIGETEVTQALWQAVMGSNPSNWKGSNLPVEEVSWNDCQTFISKLNQLTGRRFRLPTEAEWEYAARGGSKSRGYKYSGSNTLSNVAWFWENSGDSRLSGNWSPEKMKANHCKTHPVKQKQANELGIYDMSGNVQEWCQDWDVNPVKLAAAGVNDDPLSADTPVFRGGSWFDDARDCRVVSRRCSTLDFYVGLRLAL